MNGFWIGIAIVLGCGLGIWIIALFGAARTHPPIKLTSQQRDQLAQLASMDRRRS